MLFKEKICYKTYNSTKKLAEYLLIVAGTAVIAVSLQFFLDPDGMVPGGFTGIAIIVKELTKGIVPDGVPLWVTNLVLNVPMVPIVLKINGWDFAKRTVVGSLLLSFWLAVIPYVQLMEEPDLFLTSVFGGVSMGIGVGLVFLGKGTTGGTDMCGAILHHFFPYISLPKLMQLLDVVITSVGIMVFGIRIALYSIIVVYLTAKISDRIMEGSTSAKMLYIISDQSALIAEKIIEKLGRGVTGLQGRGMYTNQDKTILICVISPREIARIKDVVLEADSRAFVIVNDSREVLGEGFVEI